jgi:hypothetical protein
VRKWGRVQELRWAGCGQHLPTPCPPLSSPQVGEEVGQGAGVKVGWLRPAPAHLLPPLSPPPRWVRKWGRVQELVPAPALPPGGALATVCQ